MPTSDARIQANRQNAARSTGPKTAEGKEKSRGNALKHGLTGEGIALPNEDIVEVERRLASFRDELNPVGEVAEALVRRAAVLSVRLDRCVSHETAALTQRIRRADADFVAPEGLAPHEIEQRKAEARALAMFDPSKEASLARRYEAAAERSFHRALKEFRQLARATPAPAQPDQSAQFLEMLASFRELDNESDALEAEYLEPHERTRAIVASRAQTPAFAPAPGRVDVPITIGRPR